MTAYFADVDGDGYGILSGNNLCENPGQGFVTITGDCDDDNVNINPGAVETCNDIDDDCVDGIDNGLNFLDYYFDGDNDNYGSLDAPSPGLAGSLLTGLQYYLPFDGNINDQSGNNTSVSNQGGVTFTSDRFGDANMAGNFATNQRLFSNLDVSETAFAVSMFFKTTNPNAGFFAVTGGGHDRHIHLTGGNIRVRLWANESLQSSGLNLADKGRSQDEPLHTVACIYLFRKRLLFEAPGRGEVSSSGVSVPLPVAWRYRQCRQGLV